MLAGLACLIHPLSAVAVCRVVEGTRTEGDPPIQFDPRTMVMYVLAPDQLVGYRCPDVSPPDAGPPLSDAGVAEDAGDAAISFDGAIVLVADGGTSAETDGADGGAEADASMGSSPPASDGGLGVIPMPMSMDDAAVPFVDGALPSDAEGGVDALDGGAPPAAEDHEIGGRMRLRVDRGW